MLAPEWFAQAVTGKKELVLGSFPPPENGVRALMTYVVHASLNFDKMFVWY
jgi:hypothetical protein